MTCDILIALTGLHCHPVSVCAPPVTPSCGCQPCPQPAALSASWPSLSFPGLPVFRPHFHCPSSLGSPSVVAVACGVCMCVYMYL